MAEGTQGQAPVGGVADQPHPLAPYVSRTALDWLADEARDDQRTIRRTVPGTILFGDVAGFTPLTERLARQGKVGAEELTDILNAVFGQLLAVADGVDGDLITFGGDALLLLFTGTGHEVRAAACAVRLLETLRPYRRFKTGGGWVRLSMSIGIDSGEVHLLHVGDSHRELFAVGPVVTSAVTLESRASAGQVLLGPALAAALPAGVVGPDNGDGQPLLAAPLAPAVAAGSADDQHAAHAVPQVLQDHLGTGREDGEHRVASLAFLAFRGTDALLASEGPDRVAAEVGRVVTAAQQACVRHGVTFLATDVDADGGKILFVAGAPRAGDQDEDRLLLAVREAVSTDGALSLRAGANRGRAFAVDVGTAGRRTYAVMGDATNLAARVMGKAGRGQLLATQDLLDRTHGTFELEPLEPFLVKGKTQPVSAAVVGAAIGGRVAVSSQLPFVGRAQEVSVLRAALTAAQGGSGGVVEIIGEPGLGKSRLVDELCGAVGDGFVLTVEGGQYTATTPYAAVRAPMRLLVGATQQDDDATVADRLQAATTDAAPEALPWLPLLAVLLGVDLPDTAETAALDQRFRSSVRHVQTTALLAKVLPARTVLVVEDAHWLDDATGELLDHLCALTTERPWLVCVTRRPGALGWRPEAALGRITIELAPLTAGDTDELLRQVALVRPLAPSDRAMLAARGAGNPLFLRELLGSFVGGQHDGDVVLPDTLEGVIGASVDLLSRGEREVLRVAAVLGVGIDAPVLSRMLDRPVDDIARILLGLGRFLVEDHGTLRFEHGIVRDVAYEGLPFRRRRDLHGRAGDLLHLRLAEQESTLDLLALHYHSAERHAEAWWYCREAAERARRNTAPVEAARYYRWALQAAVHLPDTPPEDRAEVGERLGDSLELDGRYDDASRAFATARRLVRHEPMRVAGLLKKEGWVRERSGRYSNALGWYTRAQRHIADRVDEDAARARAALAMSYGAARARQGRYAASIPHLKRAATEAERLGDLPTLAHTYYLLDWALTDLGRPEAEFYREKALPIYEELGDLVGQATVLNNLGIDAYYEGRWDEARGFYERSRDVCRRSGNVVMDGTALNNIGEILSDQGHLDQADAVFHEALALWRSVRYPVGLGLCLSNLGRVASRAGRFDEASARYGEAREHFVAIGADAFVVELDSRVAELLVLQGEGAAALPVVTSALLRAESLGGMPVVLAMLERLQGLALFQTGQLRAALRALHRSRGRATEANADFELALTLHEWSRIATVTGDRNAEGMTLSAQMLLDRLGVIHLAEAVLPS